MKCHHNQRNGQKRKTGINALHTEETQAGPAVENPQMKAEQGSGIKNAFVFLLWLMFVQVFA